MGIGTSVEKEDGGVEVQSQGEHDLWSVLLEGQEEGNSECVCVFTRIPGEGTEEDLCRAAVEHLRVLRHPNLLKFLDSEISHEGILLVTEPVLPLLHILKETSMEAVIMGWRGVGTGLGFLHDKAGLSHNNLSVNCVYVSTLDGLWKVGGMEAAAKHNDINTKFLSVICDIRHTSAVPPEDKDKDVAVASSRSRTEGPKTVAVGQAGTSPSASVAVHARDVWAWGNFMLAVLEEAGLEAEIQDSAFQYINDNLLNSEPNQRPLISTILGQPWMSNLTSYLTDFLGNLTLKDRREKDKFFCSLPQQLHSLPPSILAENVLPLLLNPLVLAEPLVRDLLWKHLLLPASPQNPRTKVFQPVSPCPLLEEDLFKAHLLPQLLNLLESREYHVRMTLLQNLSSFVSLFDHDDLVDVVLPEVLVGLKDLNDDLVQATFHALGDLVPYSGADIVLGTSRRRLFADTQPRLNPLDINSSERSNRPKGRPQSSQEKMKEKREQQRQKKMTQRKLGQIVSSATLERESDVETTSSHQYSPSISHDEVESETAGRSGTTEGLEVLSQSLVFRPPCEQIAGGWDGSQGDECNEKYDGSESETDELEENEDEKAWDENWSGIVSGKKKEFVNSLSVLDSNPGSVPKSTQHLTHREPESTRHHMQSGNNKSSNFVLKSKKRSRRQGHGEEEEKWSKGDHEAMAHRGRRSGRKSNRKKVGDWKDIGAREDEDNEKQPTYLAKERSDFFADMAPRITTNPTPILHGPSSLDMDKEKATMTQPASGDVRSSSSSSSAFVYQQQQQDATSGDWEDENWGDNF